MLKRLLLPAFLLAALLPAAAFAAPASGCTVSTTSLQFGVYDTLSSANTDSTFTISYSCAAAATPVISAGQGGALSFNRAMSGPAQLRYNLYLDAARTQILGDGTSGTATFTGATGATAALTVYARIFPNQAVPAGSYSDSVVVTVTF